MVKKKILIIGARGFVGTELLKALKSQDHDLWCVTRGSVGEFFNISSNWLRVESLSQSSWDEIIRKRFDIIFHLGWSTIPRTAEADPIVDLENLRTGLCILNSIKNLAPKTRLIFTSSGGTVYGMNDKQKIDENCILEPISAYGVGKLAFEKYISLFHKRHELDGCAARLANPYGPNQASHKDFGAISTFVRASLSGEKIKIYGSLEITRDYIHVSDLAQALIKISELDNIPMAINIGSGSGLSLGNIIMIIEEITGRKIFYDMYEARKFDVQRNVLDNKLLTELTGWQQTIDIKAGIRELLLHYKNNS